MKFIRRLWGLLGRASVVGRERGLRATAAETYRFFAVRLHNHWERDRLWQGRIIEMLGNRRRIDGALIDINSPCIPTEHKSPFLKGNYEWAERRLIARRLPADLPVIELGGCLGVVSCITNRKLSSPERHVVVEANPLLLPIIERNRELNGCRFQIVPAALAYGIEEVTLYLRGFTSSNVFQRNEQAVIVPAVTLRRIAESHGFDRFSLICDVEGCEIELIEREAGFLAEHCTWMIVEMHDIIFGMEPVTAAEQRLAEHGFECVEKLRNVHCYRNRRIAGAAGGQSGFVNSKSDWAPTSVI